MTASLASAIVDAFFFFTLGALVAIIVYSVFVCIKVFRRTEERVDDEEETKEIRSVSNRYNLF